MKRKTMVMICLMMVVGILSGCVASKKPGPAATPETVETEPAASTHTSSPSESTEALTEVPTDPYQPSESLQDPQSEDDPPIWDQAQVRVSASIAQSLSILRKYPQQGSSTSVPFDSSDYQGYFGLTDRQKQYYDELQCHAKDLTSVSYSVEADGFETLDDARVAFGALCMDHPVYEMCCYLREIFDGDTIKEVKLAFFMPGSDYFMPGDPGLTTEEELRELRKELDIFDEQCNEIVRRMPQDISSYDKYRYLASVISLQTQYDHSFSQGPQIGTIYGAIQGGNAICQGYARAFQYLCQKADLRCATVSGASGDMSHMWNLVELEDGTYYVDITWSDSTGALPGETPWYDYFMITQEKLLFTHTILDGTNATGTTIFPVPAPEIY